MFVGASAVVAAGVAGLSYIFATKQDLRELARELSREIKEGQEKSAQQIKEGQEKCAQGQEKSAQQLAQQLEKLLLDLRIDVANAIVNPKLAKELLRVDRPARVQAPLSTASCGDNGVSSEC